MKWFRISLALIAFVTLVVPCTYGEHHHDEARCVELSADAHADCHSCSDHACSKPEQILSGAPASTVALPVRQTLLIDILRPEAGRPIRFSVPRPPGELQYLRTVQLLI